MDATGIVLLKGSELNEIRKGPFRVLRKVTTGERKTGERRNGERNWGEENQREENQREEGWGDENQGEENWVRGELG